MVSRDFYRFAPILVKILSRWNSTPYNGANLIYVRDAEFIIPQVVTFFHTIRPIYRVVATSNIHSLQSQLFDGPIFGHSHISICEAIPRYSSNFDIAVWISRDRPYRAPL